MINVWHATVTNLYIFLLKILQNLWSRGMCFSIRLRKYVSTKRWIEPYYASLSLLACSWIIIILTIDAIDVIIIIINISSSIILIFNIIPIISTIKLSLILIVIKQKKLRAIFRPYSVKNNLSIIVKNSFKILYYLNVTLNLSDGSYKPFHKANSEINYIHRESNHPLSIIKQLLLFVESRLFKLSSDKNVFIPFIKKH